MRFFTSKEWNPFLNKSGHIFQSFSRLAQFSFFRYFPLQRTKRVIKYFYLERTTCSQRGVNCIACPDSGADIILRRDWWRWRLPRRADEPLSSDKDDGRATGSEAGSSWGCSGPASVDPVIDDDKQPDISPYVSSFGYHRLSIMISRKFGSSPFIDDLSGIYMCDYYTKVKLHEVVRNWYTLLLLPLNFKINIRALPP